MDYEFAGLTVPSTLEEVVVGRVMSVLLEGLAVDRVEPQLCNQPSSPDCADVSMDESQKSTVEPTETDPIWQYEPGDPNKIPNLYREAPEEVIEQNSTLQHPIIGKPFFRDECPGYGVQTILPLPSKPILQTPVEPRSTEETGEQTASIDVILASPIEALDIKGKQRNRKIWIGLGIFAIVSFDVGYGTCVYEATALSGEVTVGRLFEHSGYPVYPSIVAAVNVGPYVAWRSYRYFKGLLHGGARQTQSQEFIQTATMLRDRSRAEAY